MKHHQYNQLLLTHQNSFDGNKIKVMNQKANKKQNPTPNSLYSKLKRALNAEKHNVRLQQKNILKRNTQTFVSNQKQNPLLSSLKLNESIFNNFDQPRCLSLALNTSKISVTLKNPSTPYQALKSQVSNKTDTKFLKRESFIELRKNQPQSTKMLAVKHQRIQKFFRPEKPKTQATQNQQNLTYSMILKSFTNSESVLGSRKSTQIYQANQPVQKCGRCSFHSQERAAMFFKNEEIKKNILLIEEMKRELGDKNKEPEFKHFPEVEVLNLSYFTENQKKIVNKINSRQGSNSLQKMKLFSSKKNFSKMQCPKCKQIEKKIQEQRKDKEIANLINYPNNFQYFVYEYKPTGHSTKKNAKSQKIVSQSTLYLKKNKLKTKNINNHKAKSSMNNFHNAFHDFIMHNKIDVPPRPQTAAPVKTSQQLFHYKISHPCPTQQHFHQSVSTKIFNEQNFVKPWESSGGEVDHQF